MSASGSMGRSGSPSRDPEENGHGRENNGSTPRVKVTTRSISRANAGPIARRLFRDPWTRMLRTQLLEVRNVEIWRTALLDAVITGIWTFGSIIIVCNSSLWGTSLPGRTILVGSSLHTLMFFVYLLAVTHKHGIQPSSVNLNPTITVLVVLRGIRGPLSGLLAIVGQCVGSIIAALLARELIADDRKDAYLLGGCYARRTITLGPGTSIEIGFSDHQAFLAEFMFSFTFLYMTSLLTYPKQLRLLGFKLASILIAANIGFNLYLSTALHLGYSGSQFSPARCLGSAVAYGQPLWDRLWIPFLAPFVSAIAVAFLSALVPMDHAELYAAKQDVFSKVRRSISHLNDLRSDPPGQLDDDSNTVYEVPSAGRLFSESPKTPMNQEDAV